MTAMPFGKYKGQRLSACDSGYLHWVLRECRNASPELIADIRAELAHRHATAQQQQPATAPRAPCQSAAVNQQAVMQLLNDLLVAGVHVVARGEGCIHCSGVTLTPALCTRLQRLHAVLDGLARHLRWNAHGHTRTTLASVALAGLAIQGFHAEALPGGQLAWAPHSPTQQPLVAALQQVAGEVWFRCAANIPVSDVCDADQHASRPVLPLAKPLPQQAITPPVVAVLPLTPRTPLTPHTPLPTPTPLPLLPPLPALPLVALLAHLRRRTEHHNHAAQMAGLAVVAPHNGHLPSRRQPQSCKIPLAAERWRRCERWHRALENVLRGAEFADRAAVADLSNFCMGQWAKLCRRKATGGRVSDGVVGKWRIW